MTARLKFFIAIMQIAKPFQIGFHRTKFGRCRIGFDAGGATVKCLR